MPPGGRGFSGRSLASIPSVHEMKTTADFARNNRLLCWYVGGLNFQVEHHLIPRVCSIHYPAISPIVEEVAAKYGIPYQ